MRIDASRLISIKPEMLEMLKNLEVGDTLKGRVLEALGSSIAIRTASGQIFTAMLQEGAGIPKGAFVELVVSSISDGKIYAEFKPESKDTAADAKIAQLLKQINLPVDDKNIEAAKLLIKYKLPLDKEAIVKITGLQKSIENLNQSSEGQVGLLLSGMDIKNTPVDVLNKIVLKWSSDMVSPDIAVGEGVQPGNATAAGDAAEISDNVKTHTAVVGRDNGDLIAESTKETLGTNKSGNAEANIESGKPKEAGTGNSVKPLLQEYDMPTDDNKGAELLKILNRLGIKTGSEVESFVGQVANTLAAIKNTDMETITYLVSKDIDATPKNIGLLLKNIENKEGISQFLDKLQQRINVEDSPELMEIKESIKKVFLEPAQVENTEEVADQLKDIARLGEKLESYLGSIGNKDPEIRDALSNLKDNIDFMKSINEHSNYLQLPLMINGDTSTAKLYVFKEGKRSKAIDPENATILVALDLQSLGHLESMIGVKSKAVNITFRVENKGVGAIIEKHGNILKKSLQEKGYSLGPLRIINLEQPFSLLSLEAMINEGSSDKIHFDKRI